MNLSFCDIDTKSVRAKKGEAGYDSFKKIKGIKIGALTEKKVYHYPYLYLQLIFMVQGSIIGNVKIKLPVGAPITRPNLVNWDATFNSKDIRGYNNR